MKKEICEEIFSNNMKNIALIDSSGEAVSYYELMCSSIEMANKLEKTTALKESYCMRVIQLNLLSGCLEFGWAEEQLFYPI